MFPPNNTPAGSTPPNPAQQQQTQTPDYLTKDEFNRTAAFIRGMNEKLETLTKSVPTMDAFVSMGLFEKADDGSYKVKAAPAPKPTQQQQQAADPEWKAEIDKLNTQLKQRDDALVAERRRAAETEQRSAVVEALSKAGAVNASRDHLHLGGITKNTSGKYVQIIKDEFGADKEVALD